MTIINFPSDGLYPELITLFRVVAHLGTVEAKSAIDVCSPWSEHDPTKDPAESFRLKGALARWTELGLFARDGGNLTIHERFSKKERGENIRERTARLPHACRTLMLEAHNCLPLWGDAQGIAADFVRGAAWVLAQDIYALPSNWLPIEQQQNEQMTPGHKISENDIRWNGLRFWMRYLGFATGDGGNFQADPTEAIKAELPELFGLNTDLAAHDFLTGLATRLPVLDFGDYRCLVEATLKPAKWRRPDNGHLSMSLSLALRRLDLGRVIRLEGKADAGTSYRLTGRNYRTWGGFESVRWTGRSA
jgi:hypothetical protein